MIVADANVVASFILRAEETELVLRLLAADPRWVSPPLIRSELRSVLTQQVVAKRLGLADAQTAFALAMDTLEDATLEPDEARVLELAVGSGCSSYDCEYVSVASALGCALATFDRRVLRAFPDIARHPREFLASPA